MVDTWPRSAKWSWTGLWHGGLPGQTVAAGCHPHAALSSEPRWQWSCVAGPWPLYAWHAMFSQGSSTHPGLLCVTESLGEARWCVKGGMPEGTVHTCKGGQHQGRGAGALGLRQTRCQGRVSQQPRQSAARALRLARPEVCARMCLPATNLSCTNAGKKSPNASHHYAEVPFWMEPG